MIPDIKGGQLSLRCGSRGRRFEFSHSTSKIGDLRKPVLPLVSKLPHRERVNCLNHPGHETGWAALMRGLLVGVPREPGCARLPLSV